MTQTILLVDDDANIIETATDILEAAGFQVHTAQTGAAALAVIKEKPIHLMIVDFNLPDTKGVDLAIQIHGAHPSLPIILMTGEVDVDLGTAASCLYSVAIKPVSPPDLIALLRQALNSRPVK